MRVLFLTLYPESAASPRYRAGQFIPHLRQGGLDCVVASAVTAEEYAAYTGPSRRARPFWYHFRETPRRMAQLLHARSYDAVFLQKAVMSAYVRGFGQLARMVSPKLIFDIDDAVHLAPPHPLRGIWRLFEDRQQVRRLMATARLVLAGNRWLAGEAEKEGARAEVFPTVVDTDRFVPAVAPPAAFRIGWIGSPSTTPHLEVAAPALARLEPGTLLLVGADAGRSPWGGAEVRPWSIETEVPSLQELSVGIMPLPDTPWTRGKCALKALQYMACAIPCVASPVGAVLDIIRDGENGLFADSPEEWAQAFGRLRDAGERRRLGEAGRATVEDRFSLSKAAPRLRAYIEEVA